MLALLRERCGEELPAYLSAPQGPAVAAAGSLPSFVADLAARLRPDRPDVKPLKQLLQQAVKEARQQVWSFARTSPCWKFLGSVCWELMSCRRGHDMPGLMTREASIVLRCSCTVLLCALSPKPVLVFDRHSPACEADDSATGQNGQARASAMF